MWEHGWDAMAGWRCMCTLGDMLSHAHTIHASRMLKPIPMGGSMGGESGGGEVEAKAV